MTKKTGDLIKDLCADLEPVQRTFCIYKRVGLVLLAALICSVIGVLYFGIRHDIDHRMTNATAFLIENFLMLIAGAGAAATAIQLAVPNLKISKSTWIIGSLSVLIWIGLCAHALMSVSFEEIKAAASVLHLDPFSTDYCVADLLVLGVFPGVILFAMLRKAAPVNKGVVGCMAFLAAASFAAIASRYMCAMDSFAHLLVWHFVPVILMGLLGILIGKKFLNW